MSLIHLEKQGDAWRSRVEGHFILGTHPIETTRKGLPEAMAQAVVDHCAMSGEDVTAFGNRLVAELDALKPANGIAEEPMPIETEAFLSTAMPRLPAKPRRGRVPRKAAVVAERAPVEPTAASEEPV